MTSDAITRLNAALEGRYRIERELGEGGMATVYLATEPKHNRQVAIKVLKPELAALVGAERFLGEIETTANLQHPHILPLHDSGEADGFLYYVMPYVEGETVRERLDREKQLPVEEAVRIAVAVAGALEAAHEARVVHRDIKPANILLRSGEPLITDFGIALAVGAAGGDRLTETGLSVGTPYYMSPEQATGDQHVGSATDTYALACVLYEMLVGEPPYPGSTAQAVLGKIIAGELVSPKRQRPAVPTHVDAAIRTALEKLPADRFASSRSFAAALQDPGYRYREDGERAATGRWKQLALAMSALSAILAATLVATAGDSPPSGVLYFTRPIAPDTAVRLGTAVAFGRPVATSLAFSPDGTSIVYEAGGAEGGLYMSRLDREEAERIPGTEGGFFPFFSPDGDWIAFGRPPGVLLRVPAAGGDVEMIVPALPDLDVSLTGLTWGDDGMLYGAGTDGTLVGVPGTGGEIEILRSGHDGGFPRYGPPHILPGSEAVLLHRQHSWDPENSDVVVVDLATGDETVVLENGMDARYVDTGHLLFFRQGTLMAVDFDLRTREVAGQPVALMDDVMHSVRMPNTNVEIGAAQLAVSAAGHIAYVRGGVYPERARTAVRVTSAGDTTELEVEPAEIGRLRVSPDGARVAFQAGPGVANRIFIHDLVRGQTRALATGGYANSSPAWSPDGMSIAFHSDRDQANANVYRMAVDGAAEPQRIAPSERSQAMTSWSSTGVIAFLEGGDIWVVPPDGEPRAFFESEGDERWATFSPDGAWLAYVSPDNGVYVRPYPGPEPPTLIADRGSEPAWSPDGRQIYYRADEVLYAVDVTPGADFRAGRPRVLIEPWPSGSVPVRLYDVLADGSFLTVGPFEDTVEGVSELHVVLNFFDVLEERMGRGR